MAGDDIFSGLDDDECPSDAKSQGDSDLDIVAPGQDIRAARLGGGSVPLSGTSMAAPLVSGLIALHLSAGVPASEIESLLKQHTIDLGDGGRDDRTGAGRVISGIGLDSIQADTVPAGTSTTAVLWGRNFDRDATVMVGTSEVTPTEKQVGRLTFDFTAPSDSDSLPVFVRHPRGELVSDTLWVLVQAPNLNLGLIAHYPLDGNAADNSGNGHHGDVRGPTATSDRNGNAGGALVFDGVDDYVKIPYDPSFYPKSLGISAWFRLDGSAADIQTLVSAHGTGSPLDPYILQVQPGDILSATFEGDNPPINLRAAFSVPGGWHHVAASYDSLTADARLWVDGVLVDEVNAALVLASNTLGLMLGADMDAFGSPRDFYFAGALDEIRFYSRALTMHDVRSLCDVPSICERGPVPQ